jgi:hypothetical protein
MNVGDPIVLTIELKGPPSLKNATIPPLSSISELTDRFKLRSDPMNVQLEQDRKLFSQTIRVKSESVRSVPSIEVSYFNTRSGSYDVAKSRPIPITVRPTRMLTASDLEGEDLPGISRTTVRDWEEGIRFNYTDATLLTTGQSHGIGSFIRSPIALVLFGIPLLFLAGALVYNLRRTNREKRSLNIDHTVTRQQTPPFQKLRERLEEIEKGNGNSGTGYALAAWRDYVGSKLKLRPGRLTPGEMESELSLQGLDEDIIMEILELFRNYELYNYKKQTGDSSGSDPAIITRINRLASELERRIS